MFVSPRCAVRPLLSTDGHQDSAEQRCCCCCCCWLLAGHLCHLHNAVNWDGELRRDSRALSPELPSWHGVAWRGVARGRERASTGVLSESITYNVDRLAPRPPCPAVCSRPRRDGGRRDGPHIVCHRHLEQYIHTCIMGGGQLALARSIPHPSSIAKSSGTRGRYTKEPQQITQLTRALTRPSTTTAKSRPNTLDCMPSDADGAVHTAWQQRAGAGVRG